MKRQRGLGLVYERKGSSMWWIQYSVRGKIHRESSGSTNRADAVRLLRQRISDVQTGKPVGAQVERTNFDDLSAILLNDYSANGRKSTRRAGFALARLREFFEGETRAIDITSDRITAYKVSRQQQQAANATINNELAMLRRAFRLAVDAGKVAVAPKVKMLHVDNARKGFFEPAQYDAVLSHLPGYLKIVAQVAYITGWRTTSELLTRQWRHVDLDAGWLRLDPGESKNNEARMFSLTPELRALLTAQREHVRSLERATDQIIPWVFVHDDGSRIKDFRYAWAKACRLAGVPGRLMHDFRRTAVRNLERAGVPRSAAMKMTGHKTEAVYRRYAIVDEGMMREASEKLAILHAGDKR